MSLVMVRTEAVSRWRRCWATIQHRYRLILAIFIYGLVALIPNWPILPGNSTSMREGDPTQVTWSVVWSIWSVFHWHNPWFTNYLNYPAGTNIAQNTDALLLGWLTAPITWIAGPIASWNFLQWAAFVFTASSMFLVLRHLMKSDLGPFLGGLVFGFSPYMVGQGLDHTVINFLPLVPLIFLGFIELSVRQKGHPIKWGLVLGASIGAQFLIEPEIAASAVLFSVIGIAILGIARRRVVPSILRYALPGCTVATAIAFAIIAYPLWAMFAGPYHYVGNAHPGGLTADLASSIFPTQMQRFGLPGWMVRGNLLVGGDYPENTSLLGIPFILLLGIIVVRFRRISWVRFSALMLVIAFVLSLGPRLEIDNHFTSIYLPWDLVNNLIGFNNFLTVRFTMYEFLFAGVLIALAVDAIARHPIKRSDSRRGLPRYVWIVGLGVLTALSTVTLLPRWPYPSYPINAPPYFTSKAVKNIPQGAVVLISPYPGVAEVLGQQWQALAGMRFRIIGGYGIFANWKDVPETYPAILHPSDVESFLWSKATGGTAYPPDSNIAITPKLISDVRKFIHRYNVDAVLATSGEAYPQQIETLFVAALGHPSQVTGGVSAWYNLLNKGSTR